MLSLTLALAVVCADPLAAGDHTRTVTVHENERTYLVHVPPKYDPGKPTPVVLVYHGAMTNGTIMTAFTGLNKKADEAGFIAVYPNGSGTGKLMLIWNSGGLRARDLNEKYDDVAFTAALLDDLASVANVNARRIFATGLSNGGMMCYRLAAELSDRIAAVAPVAGTMAIPEAHPKRPVPVMHFHGTVDKLVPYSGADAAARLVFPFKSVDETMEAWIKINGCPEDPAVVDLPDRVNDGTTVQRKTWGPGKEGAEVVLFVISGGGHTWPGQPRIVEFLGKSSREIAANDLIWEFFEKHPMPPVAK